MTWVSREIPYGLAPNDAATIAAAIALMLVVSALVPIICRLAGRRASIRWSRFGTNEHWKIGRLEDWQIPKNALECAACATTLQV